MHDFCFDGERRKKFRSSSGMRQTLINLYHKAQQSGAFDCRRRRLPDDWLIFRKIRFVHKFCDLRTIEAYFITQIICEKIHRYFCKLYGFAEN